MIGIFLKPRKMGFFCFWYGTKMIRMDKWTKENIHENILRKVQNGRSKQGTMVTCSMKTIVNIFFFTDWS